MAVRAASKGEDAAREAVTLARETDDLDLEVAALAVLGLTEVECGTVDQGIDHLDAAMVAATSGRTLDPRMFGEACCALLEAAGLIGDSERVASRDTGQAR